jgi:hypothetical protein
MIRKDKQVKQFTTADVVENNNQFPRIYADSSELVDDPPLWMIAGRQETATGYGKKLNSGRKIHYNGKLYRIYVTIYSNASSAWFTALGRKIYVN